MFVEAAAVLRAVSARTRAVAWPWLCPPRAVSFPALTFKTSLERFSWDSIGMRLVKAQGRLSWWRFAFVFAPEARGGEGRRVGASDTPRSDAVARPGFRAAPRPSVWLGKRESQQQLCGALCF